MLTRQVSQDVGGGVNEGMFILSQSKQLDERRIVTHYLQRVSLVTLIHIILMYFYFCELVTTPEQLEEVPSIF